MYSHHIYQSALKILMLGIILHSFISLCVYGSPDIFPLDYNDNHKFIQPDAMNFFDRLTIPSGISMILISFCTIVVFVLVTFINTIYQCCFNRLHYSFKFTKEYSTFKDAIIEIKKHGLYTYDIRSHPTYRLLIDSMTPNREVNDDSDNLKHFKEVDKPDLTIDTSRTFLEDENPKGLDEPIPINEDFERKVSASSSERELIRKSSNRSSRGSFNLKEGYTKVKTVSKFKADEGEGGLFAKATLKKSDYAKSEDVTEKNERQKVRDM